MMRVLRLFRNDALWPYVGPVVRRIAPNGPRALAGRVVLLIPLYVLFAAMNLIHAWFRAVGDNIAPFAPVNVAEFDLVVFGVVPSATLQGWLGTTGFWATFGFLYWTTLFWLPVLLVAVVALGRGRAFFLRLLLLHMTLVLSADVIYNIIPTRPPWMDVEVVRIIAAGSADGTRFDSNPFAALPSLHVAVPAAYALWFWRLDASDGWRRLGPLLGAWALIMGWCVMYTGEHYFIDVVTGYAWAGIVFFALLRLNVLYPARTGAGELASEAHDAMPSRTPLPAERAA